MSDTGDNLPEGWTDTHLDQVVAIKYGKGLPEKNRLNGNNPVYGSNGIVGYHNRPFTENETIIIGRKGSVGKIHFSRMPCWPIDTTYFIDEFKAVDSSFTAFLLQNLNLEELESSSAIPGINRERIYEIGLKLPPYNEQKRIADKIEKLLDRVNKAKARLDKVPTILKRFRQSVLSAACSGRLTESWREEHAEVKKLDLKKGSNSHILDDISGNYELFELPETWGWYIIDDLASVRGGKRLPQGTAFSDQKTPYPYIMAGALKNGTVYSEKLKYIDKSTQSKIFRYVVAKGDVYITIVGACIGDAGVIPSEFDGANLTENALKITDFNGLHNLYLSAWLRSPQSQYFIKQTILSCAQGKLALGRVMAFPIPVPPDGEQKEIVRRVEKLFAVADKIEQRLKEARQRVDKITQSILAKAFRGELVPTEAELARLENRTYETAEQLLARIQAEKQNLTLTPAKKRRRA